MASFVIEGGRKLSGTLEAQGAKNEALQILCAVLLTEEPVTIHNLPNILDVNKLIELLGELEVKVEKIAPGSYKFTADSPNLEYQHTTLYAQKASSLRGSIMLLGPLLARFGKSRIPSPGGDKIGRRRLDTHFIGFEKLGATFRFLSEAQAYEVDGRALRGSYILLDEASVTGTANILMAAVLAEGTTTLFNAACEPYIQQLCHMLNNMGAKILGTGSNLLTIEGVKKLHGTTHTLLPDMIEVGSFIGLAAMTCSDLVIKKVGLQHLGLIPDVFRRLGIQMTSQGDDLHVHGSAPYEIDTFMDGSILSISDAPWPGFTPDLLSIILVVATQAKGTVLVHQKMFESRLFFVDKLIDMGAKIILCDPHRATVIGLERKIALRGITMTSPDIRAGVALLLAALSAKGKSTILNVEQIDRGYESIDTRLQALGASIQRFS
jgi:UDP-N-acetylglucosamine 1-carboxyvinyltransferase